MSRQVELGEFVFHIDTGELYRVENGDDLPRVQRLGPQPAMLLSMLIEQRGRVVSREEIRERLWPDVTIEFEQGLHFCVRQIRSALGDTARTPKYIETLPRRGYRLIAGVLKDTPPGEVRVATPGGRRSRKWLWASAVAVVVAAGTAWIAQDAAVEPIRVAILPFDPPAGSAVPPNTASIAELLMARMARADPSLVSVVGPTTTQAYATDAASQRRLVSEMRIDYLINARFAATAEGPLMLAELIRASDGVHVWVGRFVEFGRPDEIAETIADNVLPRLDAVREKSR